MAYEDFTNAISIDRNYVDAYNNRGNALTGTGQYDKAIADYDQAIKSRPKFATSYYNRGLIMDYKGDWKESFKMYPNPVSQDELTVDFRGFKDLSNVEISITNLLGQTILRRTTKNKEIIRINTSELLKSSIYLVTVKSGKSIITSKLIVK